MITLRRALKKIAFARPDALGSERSPVLSLNLGNVIWFSHCFRLICLVEGYLQSLMSQRSPQACFTWTVAPSSCAFAVNGLTMIAAASSVIAAGIARRIQSSFSMVVLCVDVFDDGLIWL